MVNRERSVSKLQEVFSELRKQIVRSITANLPKGYLALGPALIFIEDPNMKCLYNWSNVTWEELKLGGLLKEVLRDIFDVINFYKNNKEFAKNKKLINKINKILNIYDANLLRSKITYQFDDYPLFLSKFTYFDDFRQDIESCFRLLVEVPVDSNALGQQVLSLQRFDFDHLPRVLNKLVEINKRRYDGLIDLSNELKKYDSKLIDSIGEFISHHPRYLGSTAAEPRKKWELFVNKLTTFDKGKIDQEYNSLMTDAITVFCDLPQESLSSNVFMKLKQINSDEHKKRSDKTHIRLQDLIYHPLRAIYNIEEELKEYNLYKVTHQFERLFYCDSASTDKLSIINNIIFLPVKFVDSQVIGQIALISTEPIDKSLVINSVEAYLPMIKEAARRDFEVQIVTDAIEAEKDISRKYDESLYLGNSLKKVLHFRGLAILGYQDNKWLLRKKTKEIAIESVKHNILKLEEIPLSGQGGFKPFLEWFAEVLERHAKNDFFLDNVSYIFERDLDVLGQIIAIGNDVNLPQSFFIGRYRDIAVVLYFDEDVEVMKLSGKEIHDLIKNALDQLLLVKSKATAENYKAIGTAMAHDSKFLIGITKKLEELMNIAENKQISKKLADINYLLNEYIHQLFFVLSSFDPKYGYLVQKYRRSEKECYSLAEEIGGIVGNDILSESTIEQIGNKLRSGDGSESYREYFLERWKKSNIKMIEIRIPNVYKTIVNRKSLHIVLRGLIINALEHTDWLSEKLHGGDGELPIVIVDMEHRDNNVGIIRIANIPKSMNGLLMDTNESFFEGARSVHLVTIGKAVEMGLGHKNIYPRRYDKFYICVEFAVPLIDKMERDNVRN